MAGQVGAEARVTGPSQELLMLAGALVEAGLRAPLVAAAAWLIVAIAAQVRRAIDGQEIALWPWDR